MNLDQITKAFHGGVNNLSTRGRVVKFFEMASARGFEFLHVEEAKSTESIYATVQHAVHGLFSVRFSNHGPSGQRVAFRQRGSNIGCGSRTNLAKQLNYMTTGVRGVFRDDGLMFT